MHQIQQYIIDETSVNTHMQIVQNKHGNFTNFGAHYIYVQNCNLNIQL